MASEDRSYRPPVGRYRIFLMLGVVDHSCLALPTLTTKIILRCRKGCRMGNGIEFLVANAKLHQQMLQMLQMAPNGHLEPFEAI